MVEQVAGDKATVTTIVGPDADAHLYQPNTGDAVAVAEADLVIINGMGFETWSAQLIETSGTKAAVAVATDGITPLLVDGEVDPHAWNSLVNGIVYVNNIEAALSAASPADAATFRANADAYRAKLNALHNRALADIATLPEQKRVVVTAHDAFGYLETAYGLTFLAPQGIDTDAAPSAKDLAELIDSQKDRIFVGGGGGGGAGGGGGGAGAAEEAPQEEKKKEEEEVDFSGGMDMFGGGGEGGGDY